MKIDNVKLYLSGLRDYRRRLLAEAAQIALAIQALETIDRGEVIQTPPPEDLPPHYVTTPKSKGKPKREPQNLGKKPKRSHLTAAGRRNIRLAIKRRWANYRKGKGPKPNTKLHVVGKKAS